MTIPKQLRHSVWERAQSRCEYCQMSAVFERTTFEVDHVVPEKLDGPTEFENLALACFRCNNSKGPNIAAIDPDTGHKTFIYDPRSDNWNNHFGWQGPILLGLTATGRATIALLQINDLVRIHQRSQLILEGVFPPSDDGTAPLFNH